MKKEMNGFYPQWTDVPKKERDEIWEKFLEEYSLGNCEHHLVYQKFMAQNGEMFRKFLHDLKRQYIEKYKVEDVAQLIDKSKPPFMKSDSIWKEYVRHWSSPEQRAKSKINSKNWAKRKGSRHGYRCKSAAARLHEHEKQGKTPSLLKVMINVNLKRDEKNNPTGQVHHEHLQDAIDEYRRKHRETHGPEANPEDEVLDFDMWTSTGEVERQVSHGRVLGIGSLSMQLARSSLRGI